jgi:hypothetical protein
MEAHGLVPHHPFPYSRDWYRPDTSCNATSCVCNSFGGMCVISSKCEIGEDGRCLGYTPKKPAEEKTGD